MRVEVTVEGPCAGVPGDPPPTPKGWPLDTATFGRQPGNLPVGPRPLCATEEALRVPEFSGHEGLPQHPRMHMCTHPHTHACMCWCTHAHVCTHTEEVWPELALSPLPSPQGQTRTSRVGGGQHTSTLSGAFSQGVADGPSRDLLTRGPGRSHGPTYSRPCLSTGPPGQPWVEKPGQLSQRAVPRAGSPPAPCQVRAQPGRKGSRGRVWR